MAGQQETSLRMPERPIDRLIGPIERFLHVEAASGLVLLACTIAALFLANSPWSAGYLSFWKTEVGVEFGTFVFRHPLKHWINDGLMAIFFFVVGLEVKREIVLGELRDIRRAALPIAAAVGGMVVPAGIYLLLQQGGPAQAGWGIPMATDIAFVVGCMAILGPRIPHGFRIMILSLAIADDIGAILVIAVGYTAALHWGALIWGFVGLGVVLVLGRIGVRSLLVYVVLGVLIWFGFHESGVHATVAGVALGLLTPARPEIGSGAFGRLLRRAGAVFHGDEPEHGAQRVAQARAVQEAARVAVSPVEYLERRLHPWVGFVVMPVFALANAGVPFRLGDLGDPVAVAVGAGLLIGKPVGIVGASWLAVRLRLAVLPSGVGWPMLAGGGLLAGIGFTMALFIAGLALEGELLDIAKVGILAGSLVAGVLGMITLGLLPARPRAA